ncbi:MAG: HD-GYP domain-containing protein [Desulfitobacteriia bacterium]|jgi:HD-GYP domain-containing protein (c-di-GMP phosphodiesterase class II)
MRLVNIKYVEEGSILAKPIRNLNGNVLLSKGVKLTAQYLERLKELGIETLFIEDERFKDLEIHPLISDKTRKMAHNTIRSITLTLEETKGEAIDVDSVRTAVLNIINDLLYSYDILNNLADIAGHDEYTFEHSINTTVLALVLGIGKGYDQTKLLELGMGTIMHDIGKKDISQEILKKKGKLSPEEFAEVKKHPLVGYECMRKNQDFNLNSAHVALQHHEKWNGEGYPRGLKNTEIHELGRIAAVADVYEALVSKRSYRGAYQPYEAYEYILSLSGHQFDPEIVKIFARHVAVYPIGSGVKLSNGWRGNVIKQNRGLPSRPVVRIIHNGVESLADPFDVDLSKILNVVIEKVENQ